MSRVLLVGGAGYVGSVLARELLERGYAVKILDRLYYGDDGLKDIRDRIELHLGDMRRVSPEVAEGVDAVINVGGLSNDPTAEFNPKANEEINTVGSCRLAELCKAQGVRRYLFASSCSIYDRGVVDEAQDVLQDESSLVNPRTAYARSKYDAERRLLEMADRTFCPVILRKGTIYGFSPRMRYDLVVNTFVKDALSSGTLRLDYGGAMWRPLVDVRDVCRAYVACLEADEERVRGEIFNVVSQNVRISELALQVREVLRTAGIPVDIRPQYASQGVRSYRVTSKKLLQVFNLAPRVSVADSVLDMVQRIRQGGYTDFENPRYYNIEWIRVLEKAYQLTHPSGSVLDGDGSFGTETSLRAEPSSGHSSNARGRDRIHGAVGLRSHSPA